MIWDLCGFWFLRGWIYSCYLLWKLILGTLLLVSVGRSLLLFAAIPGCVRTCVGGLHAMVRSLGLELVLLALRMQKVQDDQMTASKLM